MFNVAHERLFGSVTITTPGYMYIYLSNEETTSVEVYFDDFEVEQVKSPVINASVYYPFGLAYNSYARENSVANRWKFQGQERVEDLAINWDAFKWRNHQPDIGRFFNVDPLASKYSYNSPYAFSENQVVVHRELEGLEKEYLFKETVQESLEAAGKYLKGKWDNMINAMTPNKQVGPTEVEKKNKEPISG
jgi:RHS repeat-associated protein